MTDNLNGPVELVRSLKHRYGSAMDCIDGGSRTPEDLEVQVVPAVEALAAENIRLRAALVDVTEHATPIAEDDGFVSVGYTVTVGAIHRALAALQGASR